MIPVTVNNDTYKSISEAWRETSPADLPMITVRWRLKEGWDTTMAFILPPIPPVLRSRMRAWRYGMTMGKGKPQVKGRIKINLD